MLCETCKDPREACELVEAGFAHLTDVEDAKIFRKHKQTTKEQTKTFPKRFLVASLQEDKQNPIRNER